MRIAVLGPLEVLSDDGGPIAVPGAKERLLLAVLVAGAPDVVSRDRIEHVLWNGDRPASRAEVAAGAPGAPAQRPGARPPAGLDRALRRPPGDRLRAHGRA